MALVFTAISDSVCEVLLLAQQQAAQSADASARYGDFLSAPRIAMVAVMSIGMYGFGMSLNDIIDRRRDSQLAAHRPLPSGRIGVFTAHLICAMLVLVAGLAGLAYARALGSESVASLSRGFRLCSQPRSMPR